MLNQFLCCEHNRPHPKKVYVIIIIIIKMKMKLTLVLKSVQQDELLLSCTINLRGVFSSVCVCVCFQPSILFLHLTREILSWACFIMKVMMWHLAVHIHILVQSFSHVAWSIHVNGTQDHVFKWMMIMMMIWWAKYQSFEFQTYSNLDWAAMIIKLIKSVFTRWWWLYDRSGSLVITNVKGENWQICDKFSWITHSCHLGIKVFIQLFFVWSPMWRI